MNIVLYELQGWRASHQYAKRHPYQQPDYYNKNDSNVLWAIVMTVIIAGILSLLFMGISWGKDYTDNEIANAIYLAEGGARARVPYGILSVKVKDEAEARKVCLNTIQNNRKRYAEYGHKQYPDFLSFLASRYCPIGADNDPRNLNKNWLKNVQYFLAKGDKK